MLKTNTKLKTDTKKNQILKLISPQKIAVLYGGRSSEREISLKTGKAILETLTKIGVPVVGIDAKENVAAQIKKSKVGFCFIALHGRYGEDGTVQGLLEMMGIPYSGSGVLASALSMDKARAKNLFKQAQLPTAPFIVIDKKNYKKAQFPLPCVIKPVDGGSAIGVTIVRSRKQWFPALRTALKMSSQAIVEKFISGREVTAPVLGERALPLIEIVPKHAFYDFTSKYAPGMSQHILPARIPSSVAKKISTLALQAHQVLGCRAFSRTDFIIDSKNRPWILELNAIPGMTATSLFPESAKAVGLEFPDLLLEMIRLSL